MSGTHFDSNYIVDPVDQQPLHVAKPLQHLETVKDIVVLEMRKFFANKKESGQLLSEMPTIEKYKFTDATKGQDPFVSAVNVIRQLPDIEQKLPLFAITTATGRTKKMGLGTQYVGTVQEPPRIQTSRGPWTFSENGQLLLLTGAGQTLLTFTADFISDFNRILPVELVGAINAQSGRVIAEAQSDGSVVISLLDPSLEFLTTAAVTLYDFTGPTDGPVTNSFGFIIGDGSQLSGVSMAGANSDVRVALSLIGATDSISNPARPPKHRYQTAKDLILNIDIGADDDDQRTELTDLVCYFFELYLADRDFVLLGDTKIGQNWQIALKNELTLGGESEVPRSEGDGFAKIYVNRISLPLLSIDYVDRLAVVPSPAIYTPTLPLGSDQ